jgi:steroid delta-isomerase-like uncharacterized protein
VKEITIMTGETSIDSRRVAEQLVADFNASDLNRIEDLVATDVVYHLPPGGETLRGIEAFKQFLAGSRQGFPDKVWTIEDAVVDGEKIAFWATARGTHRADFMGIPPTGRSIDVTFFVIWRIQEGRVAEGWALWDVFTMMQQLGSLDASP